MKKLVLLILIIFILTGCTCNVKTNIKMDGTVEENVLISQKVQSNSFEIADNYIDIYKGVLDNQDYIYSNTSTDKISSASIDKNYSDICSYFNDSIFIKDSITDLSCNKNNNIYRIYFKIKENSCEDDCMEDSHSDELKFSIKVNGNVISSNADSVKNKYYTWNFNSSSTKEFILEFKVNNIKNKIYNYRLLIIISILLTTLLIGSIVLIKKYKKNKIYF